MGRRIFISYEGHDRAKAKGFNLLRWNKNVEADFVGRHLLDPVDSTDRSYITRKIKEQIHNTSVTVVLLGEHTTESNWVADEVKWSLEKDNPNGILGIRLDPKALVPESLKECGAEIIDWDPSQFDDAIDRAALAAGRAAILAKIGAAGGGCVR